MSDRIEASKILANLGCLTLIGGCSSALGLVGHQIYSEGLRKEHLINTREALSAQGLEFWSSTQNGRDTILNVHTHNHFFKINDPDRIDQSIKFLEKLGYQNIEDHKFKGGLHIVIGSTNQVVFDNLGNGIYQIK
jgi:hypothetical protein